MSVKHPDSKQIFGKGKFAELTEVIVGSPGISAVFISVDILSAHQLTTLRDSWKLPIFDR